MQLVFLVADIVLGVVQLAAVTAGLKHWLHLPGVLAVLAALFLAFTPILGTVLAVFGAMSAWHWPWIQAVGVFVGPILILLAIAAGKLVLESSDRW